MMDTYGKEHKKVCSNCQGSKEQMGGGMLREKCRLCSVEFHVEPKIEARVLKIDKRSKSYKALKDMGLSDDDIAKKFAEAV